VKNEADGGEAILEAFRSLKVDHVISSPGSEWPSFWEAVGRQKQSGTAGPIYLTGSSSKKPGHDRAFCIPVSRAHLPRLAVLAAGP
jgi:hypothetical protein